MFLKISKITAFFFVAVYQFATLVTCSGFWALMAVGGVEDDCGV